MYNTTYNNIQKERQLDRAEEEVGTGRCIQHTTIYRKSDRQRERRRWQVQVDVYHIHQQVERQLDREEGEVGTDRCLQLRTIERQRDSLQRGGGGRYRQMYTTQNNRQIERQLDREEQEEEVGTNRCIQHRTIDRQIDRQSIAQINRQIERQLDKEEEEEVGTDRCTQHKTIDRQRDSLSHKTIDRQRQFIERRRRKVQIDVYTTYNNRQIERQLDRKQEEVDTDRCIIQHTTIYRKSDSQIEPRRRQVQVDVYNIQQYIERAIVRESGGGGRYRQMYTTYINRQRDSQIERKGRQVQIDVYN